MTAQKDVATATACKRRHATMTRELCGEIRTELSGEWRVLRLGIGDLEALEERLGLGLPEIIRALAQGRYRLGQLREIITVALKRGGWKGSDDDVRAMIRDAGPGACQVICMRLFNVALGNDDKIVDATCDGVS